MNQRLADAGAGADRAGQQAVHAHAARDRHAPADGRGPRLPRQAARLHATSPTLANDPEGWAKFGHPGVGPVPAGQDQPQLLDERAELHHRRVLRRHRQDRAGSPRRTWPGPTSSSSPASVESAVVHYGDTTLTFLNNWYRADARGTALTYVSAVAVEEKSVLDYNARQPRRRARSGRGRPPAQGAAGGHLPRGGHALLRQPAVRPRRAVGERRAAAGGRALPRLRPAAREPAAGARVRLPPRQPAGGRRPRPIVAGQRRRPRPSPRPCSRCPTPAVLVERARQVGRAAQGGPGAAGDRRVGLDGRPGRARRRHHASSTWPSRRPIASLDQFKDDDEVGLRIFTTDITGDAGVDYLDLRPGRAASARPARRAGRRASATSSRSTGTPLYDVTAGLVPTTMRGGLRPGQDQRRRAAHRRQERGRRPQRRRSPAGGAAHQPAGRQRGRHSEPVRVFAIAYGEDADLADAAPHRRGHQRRRLRRQQRRRRSTRSSPRWCPTSDGRRRWRSATGCSRREGRRGHDVAVGARAGRSRRRRRHRRRPRRSWPPAGIGAAAWAVRVAAAAAAQDPRARHRRRRAARAVAGLRARARSRPSTASSAAVRTMAAGPLRDRLAADRRAHRRRRAPKAGAIARRADEIEQALAALDADAAQRELAELQALWRDRRRRPTEPRRRSKPSSPRPSAGGRWCARPRDRLRMLDARLDELVARAVEVSVGAGDTTDPLPRRRRRRSRAGDGVAPPGPGGDPAAADRSTSPVASCAGAAPAARRPARRLVSDVAPRRASCGPTSRSGSAPRSRAPRACCAWVALASALGQASLSDAFNLANNSPNAVYELLLGGVLSATLVPVFTAHARGRDDEDATDAVVTVAAIALGRRHRGRGRGRAADRAAPHLVSPDDVGRTPAQLAGRRHRPGLVPAPPDLLLRDDGAGRRPCSTPGAGSSPRPGHRC